MRFIYIKKWKWRCVYLTFIPRMHWIKCQYYQQEAAKLRAQIGNLQNANRQEAEIPARHMQYHSMFQHPFVDSIYHFQWFWKYTLCFGALCWYDFRQMLGENVSSMNMRDIKNMETKLETSLRKIRCKKVLHLPGLNWLLRNLFLRQFMFRSWWKPLFPTEEWCMGFKSF